MSATERVIDYLNVAKLMLCNPQVLTPEMCVKIGQAINSAIDLLKEQESVVRCKDCVHWIPGEITDKDDFIQPRCRRNGGGWASDDYCSCAERREAACTSNCTS